MTITTTPPRKKWRYLFVLLFSIVVNGVSSSLSPPGHNSPLITTTTTRRRRQQTPISTHIPTPTKPTFTPPRGGAATSTLTKELSGASYFVIFDLLLRRIFSTHGVKLPSMMAGCVGLFTLMILVDVIRPGWGDAAFELLSPGATFLVKWMPVCFVPGLVMLPLAPKIGDVVEYTKFFSTIIIGFFFSVVTISFSVLSLRGMQGLVTIPSNDDDDSDVAAVAQRALDSGKKRLLDTASKLATDSISSVSAASKKGKDATIAAATKAARKGKSELLSVATKAAREAQDSVTRAAFKAAEKSLPLPKGAGPAKPYSAELVRNLTSGAVALGVATVYATLVSHPTLTTPLRTGFMLCTSIASFVFGARLPPSFNKVVHPLVTSTALTLLTNALAARLTSVSFDDLLATYKTNNLSWNEAGAGDLLLFLLGPCVIALAVPMYSRKTLMKDNVAAVVLSTLVSSLGGLFSTAVFVKLVNVLSRIIRLSLLTRNVTTALAIPITQILGGDISICACVNVLTGIFGATVGARLLTFLGVTDPVSRGLGMGGSSFALGAASIVGEKDAFPFAAIAMVTTAVCSTVVVSCVPVVRELLIKLTVDEVAAKVE